MQGVLGMSVTVLHGDCRAVLPTLDAGSVQCCVTSPPYYGLRSYLPDGHPDKAKEIGLEQTPDEYVAEMVAVFREVRRVLRDDGVLFLNIGDSYRASGTTTGGASTKSTLGGGGGKYRAGSKAEAMFNASRGDAPRAASYGKRGKAPANFPASDCLCGSLCGACRAAYRLGKSHSDTRHAPTLNASTAASIPARRELQPDHPPTSDFARPADRSGDATPDLGRGARHAAALPPAAPASTTPECETQLQGAHSLGDASLVCRLCGVPLSDCAPAFADMTACTCDTELQSAPSSRDTSGTVSSGLAYPSYTTKSLVKPKDLIGIPWLLAFALRADGWFLRSDIIWHKPNPMPESVRDRPTSAHEHVFLLSKRAAYFYDADAVREEPTGRTDALHIVNNDADGVRRKKQAQNDGTIGANARNVWTIATQPYSGAHFATMPPGLAERCIKAGTKPGDTVLDPFGGAGTTGLVADRLNRNAVLVELNPEYRALAQERITDDAPLLARSA